MFCVQCNVKPLPCKHWALWEEGLWKGYLIACATPVLHTTRSRSPHNAPHLPSYVIQVALIARSCVANYLYQLPISPGLRHLIFISLGHDCCTLTSAGDFGKALQPTVLQLFPRYAVEVCKCTDASELISWHINVCVHGLQKLWATCRDGAWYTVYLCTVLGYLGICTILWVTWYFKKMYTDLLIYKVLQILHSGRVRHR